MASAHGSMGASDVAGSVPRHLRVGDNNYRLHSRGGVLDGGVFDNRKVCTRTTVNSGISGF